MDALIGLGVTAGLVLLVMTPFWLYVLALSKGCRCRHRAGRYATRVANPACPEHGGSPHTSRRRSRTWME